MNIFNALHFQVFRDICLIACTRFWHAGWLVWQRPVQNGAHAFVWCCEPWNVAGHELLVVISTFLVHDKRGVPFQLWMGWTQKKLQITYLANCARQARNRFETLILKWQITDKSLASKHFGEQQYQPRSIWDYAAGLKRFGSSTLTLHFYSGVSSILTDLSNPSPYPLTTRYCTYHWPISYRSVMPVVKFVYKLYIACMLSATLIAMQYRGSYKYVSVCAWVCVSV